MGTENIGNYKPIERLIKGLDESKKDETKTNENSTPEIFSEIKQTLNDRKTTSVSQQTFMRMFSDKYDLDEENTALQDAISTIASMDDRNTVSLADFGIYQFSNDILAFNKYYTLINLNR